MKIEILIKELNGKQKEIQEYARNKFPRKAAKMAVDHYKENFVKSGFVDNGLHKWRETNREKKHTKYANSQYKTLLSGRNNLYESIRGSTQEGRAIISTDVEYAAVHNFGFRGTQYVNPHKRGRKVVAMSLKERKTIRAGGHNVKGHSRQMNIPQRQFIGPSQELSEKLKETAERDLMAILNS